MFRFFPREFTFNLRLFNRCTCLKKKILLWCGGDGEKRISWWGHTGILDAILHESSKINQTPSIGNCTEFTFDFLQWCPFRISGILYLIFFWFTFFITFFTQKNHVLSSKTLKPSRVLVCRGVKHIFVHSNLLPFCWWELSRKENVEGVSMGDLISFVILFLVEGSHFIILGIHTFM